MLSENQPAQPPDVEEVGRQLMSESSFQLNNFELVDTVSMDTTDFFNVLDAIE